MYLVLLQALQTLTTLCLPTLNAYLIDRGVARGDTDYIVRAGAAMVVLAVVQVVASVSAVRFASLVAMGMGRDIRSAVFRRVQDYSAREVGQFGTPSLINRTVNDVQQVQTLVLTAFSVLVSAPVMCVGGVVMALEQDVPLSGLLLVLAPVVAVVAGIIVTRMEPLYRRQQVWIDRLNRVLREQITGVRVIRAFVRDRHERRRAGQSNTVLYAISLEVGKLTAATFPAVMLVTNVFSVAFVWFGGMRIDGGAMEIGALTAFLSYLGLILLAFVMAMFVCLMAPRAIVSAERIHDVLETESSVVPAPDPVTLPIATGRVELRDAGFRYPGAEEPVLRGIELLARPGETVAVVGSTGSGKSTLLNLVLRLIDATEGSVLIDGVDVRELDQSALTRIVGMVAQKPYLFSGTIATNLRYGNPDATDDELWDALETAQAADFVRKMPGGLNAAITQGGGTVSGGQRQRLAIARTLVHKPMVYLFDDSFSALDYMTDAALRAALASRTASATVIVVAQRISTIRNADRIVVLDEGRGVGTGTHSELMKTCETYQEIVLSQLSEREAA